MFSIHTGVINFTPSNNFGNFVSFHFFSFHFAKIFRKNILEKYDKPEAPQSSRHAHALVAMVNQISLYIFSKFRFVRIFHFISRNSISFRVKKVKFLHATPNFQKKGVKLRKTARSCLSEIVKTERTCNICMWHVQMNLNEVTSVARKLTSLA